MADRQQVIGGIFRGLISGGSWIRLVYWCKKEEGRKIRVGLEYTPDGADWTLALVNPDGSSRFEGHGTTLEGVTIEAMGALGKEGLNI